MTRKKLNEFIKRLRELDDEILLREFADCYGYAYYLRATKDPHYEQEQTKAALYYQEILVRLEYRHWYNKPNVIKQTETKPIEPPTTSGYK